MKTSSSPDELRGSVRAEAAAWVARLHGSDRSRALEGGLQRWLQADPAHARAFEIATEAWELGASIPGAALPRMADPHADRGRTPARTRRHLAAAAALSAIAIGALLYVDRMEPSVSTAIGEQRMLTMADGSRIFLNTDTRLFVTEEPARRHVGLDSGEALFDVTRDPSRPFVVTAGDKEVVALGTSFVVRREPRQLTVTLVEGKVAVSSTPAEPTDAGSAMSPAPGHTVLTPGQRLTFVDSGAPQLDQPPLERITAWRRGEVILDKTRLQDAVDEMNRYSTMKIVVDDAAPRDIRISGIFRAGDSTRFALAVGETYHLGVSQSELRIVISGSRQ